ncbi:hypothetical protein ABPG75_007858 [Micractinium tetrahymenae]
MAPRPRQTSLAALPAAHDLAQDLVAAQLPQEDRLRLAATCRTLHIASLRWFPKVRAQLTPGNNTAAESLAAWLCSYRACAHLSFGDAPVTLRESRRKTAVPAMLRLLAARPTAAACIASLGASSDSESAVHPCEVPTQCLLAFPSLEGLEHGTSFLSVGPLDSLWQLTKLQHLSLHGWKLSGSWAGITRLSQLRKLELEDLNLAAVVPALPALAPRLTALALGTDWPDGPASWAPLAQLTGLQSLVLYLPEPGDIAPQLPALAPSLQSLALSAGGLDAPPELAACSRLTWLELGSSHEAEEPPAFHVASLSVLGALTRLQHLAISAWPTDSDDVPGVLSELSALTHLSLDVAILQMTQLRALGLHSCEHGPLPAEISGLSALTSLSLSWCPRHQQQEAVASLERLRPLAATLADLSLTSWRLTAIPLVLTALSKLTHLNLSHNRISGGWGQLQMGSWLRRRSARASRNHAASPSGLPGAHDLVQDLVAAALPQADRLRLSATCRTLHAASLRWFPDEQAELTPGDSAAAKSLAAWLCRYRARAHVAFGEAPATLSESQHKAALLDLLRQLAELPAVAACVASLGGSSRCGSARHLGEVPTRCLLAFPSLEGLQGGRSFKPAGPVDPLWQLTKLTHLSLDGWKLEGSWAGITRLSQLRKLYLSGVELAVIVPVLPALRRLTALTLHCYTSSSPASWVPLSQLTGLQSLVLYIPALGNVPELLPGLGPSLQALVLYAGGQTSAPPQLAACSRLTRLELGAGLGHHAILAVASLSLLSALNSLQCLRITAWSTDPHVVPAVLSELSTLTHLSLHARFRSGWVRLQPLALLQELSIQGGSMEEWAAAELAATLAAMSSITSLSLSGISTSPFWGPTWQAVVQMMQLRALALDSCERGPLPPALSSLRALSRLSLTCIFAPEPPPREAVASLEHLRPLAGTLADLSLSGWQCTSIPPVLTALTALTH